MKKKLLSLSLIFALALAAFSVSGVALAQDPPADEAAGETVEASDDGTVTSTEPVTDTTTTGEGDATEGDTGEGDADEGDATEGDTGEGDATEGDTGEGDATEGDTGEGDATEGDTGEGDATEGDATEGDATEGDATEGDTTEGDTGEGDTGEGDATEGDTGEGDATEGDTGEGDATEGDATEGDATEGDATEGDTTEGDTGEGDTGEGDATEGDTGEGDATEGDTGEGDADDEDVADEGDELGDETGDEVEEVVEEEPEEVVEEEATPEPEVETEGDVGTAAVVGNWTTELISIQNLDADDPANVSIELYAQAATQGTPQTTTPTAVPVAVPQIPVGGVNTVDISGVSDGSYSGIVSSDSQVAVTAFQRNSLYQAADLHVGFDSSSLAEELIIARIFNNHFGYKTKLHVQNAHSAAQDITVELYAIGDATPTASYTYTGVALNTSFTIDISTDSNFSSYPSGNNVSLGYARVRGADGNVAVVADSIRDTGVSGEEWRTAQVSIPGIAETSAASFGESLIIPRVFNVYFTWDTGVPVVNLSGSPTDVRLTYTDSGNVQHTVTKNAVANGGVSFFLPTDFPDDTDTFGGVEVECLAAGCQIVAVSNNVYKGTGTDKPSGAGNAPALNGNLATNAGAVPLVFREGTVADFDFNDKTTGVVVYNVTGGTVTTKWTKANADPTVAGNVIEWTMTGQTAGSVSTFFAPNYETSGSYPLDNFGTGSVFVESTGTMMIGTTYNFGNTRGSAPAYQYSK